AMVRHAACRAAQSAWAPPFPGDAEVFVAGHVGSEATSRQGPTPPRFSYLPVPSAIGPHPDGAFRRIFIAEPFGGTGEQAAWATNVLSGLPLIREETGDIVAVLEPLERWHSDKLVPAFIGRQDVTGSRDWVSVTPVVLPGYDDRNRTKAEELLLRACDHAGFAGKIRAISFEPPPRHAASSGRVFLPRHLRGLPLHHVRLQFHEPVVGPVSLGAGRHCGLGLFIAE
ncbi:MAG: type I-U CRISPR-associated protein Csb2, partial [Planctomycetota bacterium]|nr:type I-U CRISPR-associated protein Csb2 [Planctomycetota bacterium]